MPARQTLLMQKVMGDGGQKGIQNRPGLFWRVQAPARGAFLAALSAIFSEGLEEIGVDAVLVGETLMRASDKKARLHELRSVP